jgi:hypothetical protein
MSLQGLTVAISPSGAQYFANLLLVPNIASALQGVTVPNNTIPIPEICLASSRYSSTWADNISIALSGGSLSSFNPAFQNLSQGADGTFTLVISASNVVVHYNWNEQYDTKVCTAWCVKAGHTNNNYNYTIGIGSFQITAVFQFAYHSAANTWGLDLISTSSTTSSLSPNIPSNSIVNDEEYSGCFSRKVSDATQAAVSAIDFNSPINALLKPLFKSIPASGQLTSDIAFQFPIGPSGLAFPGNAGIATGVTGIASYQGAAYDGANPPQLPVPAVPTDHHLNYYVSDYTINSLFWAFYSQGLLVALATPANIPDPAALNTANYNNTPLQALYNAYPNVPMTAAISATAAPTVAFKQIYDLTGLNLPNLQGKLPTDTYNKLLALTGQVFFQETAFFAALVNAIGETDADRYKTTIESVALVTAAVVQHDNQVVMNVIVNGETIPVFTLSIQETDVLQAFVLGTSGTTQTLQFAFQIVPPLTTAALVSSTIPGINASSFPFIWNYVLQTVFATEVAKMGQAGVALPRIQGFNFLFTSATVTLNAGYAAVLTDVLHVSDPDQVLYLQSKRVIQHGDSIVSSREPRPVRRIGPWSVVRTNGVMPDPGLAVPGCTSCE